MTAQKNQLAEESTKTQRDRKKLEARLKEMDEKITQEALRHAAFRIKERINRLAALRVPLGNSFELFDSNKHPKELSERVRKIAEGIHTMMKVHPPKEDA